EMTDSERVDVLHQLDSVQSALEQSQLEIESLKASEAGLAEQLNAETQRAAMLVQSDADLQQQLNQKDTLIGEFQTRLATYESQLLDSKNQFQQLDASLDESVKSNTQLRNHIKLLQTEYKNLGETNSGQQAALASAEEKNLQLETTLNDMNAQLAELAKSEEALAAAQMRIGEYETQIAQTESASKHLNLQLYQAQTGARESELALTDLQTQQQMLESEITALDEELELSTTKIESLQASIEQLTSEKQQLEASNQSGMSELETTAASLDQQTQKLSETEDALATAQSDLQALEQQKTDLTTQNASLSEQVTTAEARIADLTAEVTALDAEKTLNLNKIEAMTGVISEDTAALSSLNEQLGVLGEENTALRAELNSQSAAGADMSNTISMLESELNTVLESNTGLEEERLSQMEKLNNMVADREDLLTRLKDLDSRTAQLTQDLEARQIDLESLKSINADLERNLDQQKADRTTLEDLLNKTETEKANLTVELADTQAALVSESARADSSTELADSTAATVAAMEAEKQADVDAANKLKTDLENAIEKAGIEGASLSLRPDNSVAVILSSEALFRSGSARVSLRGQRLLDNLTTSLESVDVKTLRVEGHTDAVPIAGNLRKLYPSNWSLSVARAASTINYLLFRESFEADQLAAVGYGEHRPVGDNSTAEGRAQNRRVELVFESNQ
ncbi:MAG: OmpA family protein, partial [Gammaproteobacteria bacterium]|nr:OmpA family protein [Gammaproteobacteria bacterium]